MVSGPYFVATKLEAFFSRGGGDYMASHDLEDIIAVVDGRSGLVEEIRASAPTLQHYLSDKFGGLLAVPAFVDAIPGHLPGDEASQGRAALVLQRLREIRTPSDLATLPD